MTPHKHGHGHDHKDDSDAHTAKIDYRRISGMAFEVAKSGMAARAFDVFTAEQLAEYCVDVATRIEKVRINGKIDDDIDQE